MRFTAALRLLQAGEAFCFVEVEVFVRDDPLEAQKVLDFPQFASRIGDEPLATDQMDLIPGKPGQPALQVLGIEADPQRAPQRVDLTWRQNRDALFKIIIAIGISHLPLYCRDKQL